MEETIRLFVYGTLRKGGRAEHFLREFKMVSSGIRLNGYTLYDAGWYPFGIRASNQFFVIGDIFEVPTSSLPELDAYEGPEYKRLYLEDWQFYIYLKRNSNTNGLVQVESGDWLSYWKQKNA